MDDVMPRERSSPLYGTPLNLKFMMLAWMNLVELAGRAPKTVLIMCLSASSHAFWILASVHLRFACVCVGVLHFNCMSVDQNHQANIFSRLDRIIAYQDHYEGGKAALVLLLTLTTSCTGTRSQLTPDIHN